MNTDTQPGIKSFNAASLKIGFDQFRSPRQPGDIDLVAMVREALVNNGLGDRVNEAYDLHPYILEAADKTPPVQKFQMNRYWLCQLVQLYTVDTMEVRSYLLPSGSEEIWFQAFLEKVLPFLIQNGLPVKLT